MLFRRPGAGVHPIPWFSCHFMEIHPKREISVKSWFIVKSRDFMVKYVKPVLSPVPGGPCKILYNTCKFHALLRPRAAGNAQKLKIWWKWWNSAEFHSFWWFSPKKHPELRFWWKSTPKRTFRCPGALKSIGKALVSLVFPPRGRPGTISTPRSWKWCEITPFPWNVVKFHPFPPKLGNSGEFHPRAGIPLPEPY